MTFRILAAVAAIALLSGGAPRGETVLWRVSPVLSEGAVTRLDLSLSFPGGADGETTLQLPSDWGGEQELWRSLWDIRADGAQITPGESPDQLILTHAPGAALTLHWKAGGGPDTPPGKHGGNDYRPRIAPDHFFAIGHTLLPWPDTVRDDTPARLALDRPEGLTLVSDAELPAGKQAAGFGTLARSVLFGGDIRVIDAGGGARLALAGEFETLTDAFWKDTFTRVTQAERKYWKAKDEPFLVTVISETRKPGDYSIGGTGLDDAFALFATQNIRAADAVPLIAHEMMHTWVPGRIGRMPEEDEAVHYWLSEGFTDWATFRALVRGGLWTPAEFAQAFNASLSAYDLSPVKAATADEIRDGFWKNQEMSRLPYQKGLLIAAWLDARIREETKGRRDLDDVLLKMQRAAKQKKHKDTLAYNLLVLQVKKVSGWDPSAELEALAMAGADPGLPADLFALCGRLTAEDRLLWERGFDFSATADAGWKIQGVIEGSNAWEAGLRNDMELRSWSEDSRDRDVTQDKTALVTEGEGLRAISWLPAGRETRRVRSFELTPDLGAPALASCEARLAGN